MCSTEEGGFLHNKFLCRDHFLPTGFMTPEGICLISLAVPCGLDLASHSIPQASPLSNLPFLPPLPLPSELTHGENSLHILPLLRTCSKLPLSSTRIDTPLPTHMDGPSTSFRISVSKLTLAIANIFSIEDASFFLSVDASDWEYRCLND
jgi:hypothetical protein